QRGLVVSQIALTQPLLAALAVVAIALSPEFKSGPGADVREHVASMSFNMAAATAAPGTREERSRQMEDRIAEMRRLRDRLAESAGVQAAVFEDFGTWQQDFVVHPGDRIAGATAGVPTTLRSTSTQPGYF